MPDSAPGTEGPVKAAAHATCRWTVALCAREESSATGRASPGRRPAVTLEFARVPASSRWSFSLLPGTAALTRLGQCKCRGIFACRVPAPDRQPGKGRKTSTHASLYLRCRQKGLGRRWVRGTSFEMSQPVVIRAERVHAALTHTRFLKGKRADATYDVMN